MIFNYCVSNHQNTFVFLINIIRGILFPENKYKIRICLFKSSFIIDCSDIFWYFFKKDLLFELPTITAFGPCDYFDFYMICYFDVLMRK